MLYIFILFLFALFIIRKNKLSLLNKNIIVTGASSNHELSLLQFIYHCFNNNKDIALVVWDLGLSKIFRKLILSVINHYKYIIYKKFDYSKYPSYFNISISQGEYAWKAIIINTTFHMVKKTVLWIDSGCLIGRNMIDIFETIEKYHCWSSRTNGNIKRWTHIGMIKYYNLSYNLTQKRMCNGAIVGFKWNSSLSTTILKEWAECAYIKNCIAPNGSSRANHRQDQSALSILIYIYKIFKNCPNNRFNIHVHHDLKNIQSANEIYKNIFKRNSNYF